MNTAESYLDLTHWSRHGLIQQPESHAGSGFTHEQAVHNAIRSKR